MPAPLEDLLTEQVNPASEGIDALPAARILEIINAEDRQVADAVARARAVDAIVAAFRNGGRLFYIGAGTSGRLGVLDAAECPPTFNVPPDLVQGHHRGRRGGPVATRPRRLRTIRQSACAICRHGASARPTCSAESPPAAARLTCWGPSTRPIA
jgi:hypothetical protein